MYIMIDQPTYNFSSLPSWCCFRKTLIKHKNTYKLVFIYKHNMIIGYYVYDDSKMCVKIILFQIHPDYVNMGHGSLIISVINKRHNKIVLSGKPCLALECDIECSPFYLKNGFKISKLYPYSCKMTI